MCYLLTCGQNHLLNNVKCKCKIYIIKQHSIPKCVQIHLGVVIVYLKLVIHSRDSRFSGCSGVVKYWNNKGYVTHWWKPDAKTCYTYDGLIKFHLSLDAIFGISSVMHCQRYQASEKVGCSLLSFFPKSWDIKWYNLLFRNWEGIVFIWLVLASYLT